MTQISFAFLAQVTNFLSTMQNLKKPIDLKILVRMSLLNTVNILSGFNTTQAEKANEFAITVGHIV